MIFDSFSGNEHLIERLKGIINSGNIGHAYIFESGRDTDKLSFATDFIKGILCENGGCGDCPTCRKIDEGNYADIHYVYPDGASVKDKQIELMQDKLRIKPYGDRNIAVISDADSMTEHAQNRLLKTLEEPYGNTVIVLLSDNVENFLQTIRSRCQIFHIEGGKEDDKKAFAQAEALELMLYEEAPFYELKKKAEKLAKDRELTRKVLDCLEKIYAGYLTSGNMKYSREYILRAVTEIEEARRRITRNMNVAYALKQMLLKIGG